LNNISFENLFVVEWFDVVCFFNPLLVEKLKKEKYQKKLVPFLHRASVVESIERETELQKWILAIEETEKEGV